MQQLSPQMEAQLKDPRRRKYLDFEQQIFAQKFQPEEFKTHDLPISPKDFIHYTVIRRIEENDHNVLVILHGYAGFGGVFYRLVDELSRHFFIILVDMPDMGFSSRQSVDLFNDTDTTIEYFVSRIQSFIQKMQLKNFSLMGHSIGAFIAAHTFARLHPQIQMLYLLSPAGFNKVGDPAFTEKKKQFMENSGFIKRYLVEKIEEKLYKEKQSPFEMFWLPMRAKKWMIKKYWQSGRFRMTEQESRLFYKVQAYFLSQPQNGERCLGYLLHFGVNSTRPIIEILMKLKDQSHKVRIYFGDHDWMDAEASKKNVESNELDVPVFFVSNSEHQLIFQNPTEIACNVLEGHHGCLERLKKAAQLKE